MNPRIAIHVVIGVLMMLLAGGVATAAPSTDFFVAPPAGQSIATPPGADPAIPADVAEAWALRNRARTGLARDGASLEVREVEKARDGVRVVRMQQEVEGIPVFGAETVVAVERDGDIASVTGERLGGPTPDLQPRIGADAARGIAAAASAKQNGASLWQVRAGPARRVIFEPGMFGAPSPERSYLAWEVEVDAPGGWVSDTVLVHAVEGYSTIIPRRAHVASRRVCNGNGVLEQNIPCLAGGAARADSATPSGDAQVDSAYDFITDTWNYYFTNFGRNSFDNAGAAIIVTVRACPKDQSCPSGKWANAWWSDSTMALGHDYNSDDVVAHEFTHGVTDATANLRYYYQSGAINESMSDFFGEMVDLGNGRGTDTSATRWLVGDDSLRGIIRSMKDPPAYSDADRTGSSLYQSGTADNGGVHSNSGVGNKAAYLITDGGTFNGRTIAGLGQAKAQQIYYRALTTGLRSGSDWQDLRSALYAACTGLVGTYGITTTNCLQVDNAALATEMNLVPALAPGTKADVCPVGQLPTYAVSDDVESLARWTRDPSAGAVADNLLWITGYATSGIASLRLITPETAIDGAFNFMASTGVVVPSGGYLRFNHAYWLDTGMDGGVVEYSTFSNGAWGAWTSLMNRANSGYVGATISAGANTALSGATAFTGVSRGYGSTRFDLSSLAGRTVRFRFRVVTDASVKNIGWYIDDVGVYNCGAGDTTPPETTITSGPGAAIRANWFSFQFISSEANSTFQCSVDGSAYSTCTSPKVVQNLAVGNHTFLVKARDPSGNWDPSPAVAEFTVDQTPPGTTITASSPSATTSSTISISFTSDDAAATFMCALDAGSYSACTSPKSWTGVADGNHTMRVYAVDAAGNVDSTPDTRTVRVDTTAPTATFTQTPGTYSRSTTVSIGFSSNEAATGVTFQCRRDAAPYGSCTSPKAFSGLTQGLHTVDVIPLDAAGNTGSTASTSFTVDSVAPDTSISSGPGAWLSSGSASVAFSSTETGSTFLCALDDTPLAACTSPTVLAALADGPHVFRVAATDPAGNTDASPSTTTFTVDTTDPETVLTAGPGPRINTTSTTFAFDGRDANFSTFNCKLDVPTWSSCSSPRTLSGLSQGSHTFGARAVDMVNNVDKTPVTVTFEVDLTAPSTTITSGPAALTAATSVTIAFSSGDPGDEFECQMDTDDYVGCTSPFTWDELADGDHEFRVRATDIAGNTDASPALRAFTVDTTAPVTTITLEPDPSFLASTATVGMTADDPDATFQCAKDSGVWSACSSPHTFSGLALGDHELSVRAVDQAGNVEDSPQVLYVTREDPQLDEAGPPADPADGSGDSPGDPAGEAGGSPGGATGPGGGAATGNARGAVDRCAGKTGLAKATCQADATLQAELARAKATLDKALAACAKGPAARRAACRARAQAAYRIATGRARATATLAKAKAACAAGPAAKRAACTRKAQAAYAATTRRLR